MTQRVHQGATLIGQNHHALAVAHLLEQEFHHGSGVRKEIDVEGQCVTQANGAGVFSFRQACIGQQPSCHAAPPGASDALVDPVERKVAVFLQMQARLAQGQSR